MSDDILRDLTEARIDAIEDLGPGELRSITACRGPRLCPEPVLENFPCPWCYTFTTCDPRSTAEILTDMNRMHS